MDDVTSDNTLYDADEQTPPLPPLGEGMVLAKPEYFMNPKDETFESPPGMDTFSYWTTRMGELTGGRMGATMLRATAAAAVDDDGSPWHYHKWEISMSVVLKGSAVFEFEGVGEVTFEPGMVIYQAAMNRHRQLSMSADFEALEINLPASVDTHIMIPEHDTKEWSEFVVTVGS